jgi:hypothetical protein
MEEEKVKHQEDEILLLLGECLPKDIVLNEKSSNLKLRNSIIDLI